MTNNYCETANMNEKASFVTLRSLSLIFEDAFEHFNELFYNEAFWGFILPQEFYDGFDAGADYFWSYVIPEYFEGYGWDDIITFEQIVESLGLKQAPKNTKELVDMSTDLRVKRIYQQRLYRHKLFVMHGEKEKPDSMWGHDITDIKAYREDTDKMLEELGKKFLYIDDFYDFGMLYAKIVALEWGWSDLDYYI